MALLISEEVNIRGSILEREGANDGFDNPISCNVDNVSSSLRNQFNSLMLKIH